MARVVVVGAGVIGLTLARVLAEEPALAARVVAERDGLEESSGAAGALWLLYGEELAGAARPARWARASYAWLSELARTRPAAGVDLRTAWLAAEDAREPTWIGSLPREAGLELVPLARAPRALAQAVAGSLPFGAWRLRVPVVTPRLHLPWLRAGLELETRRVDALDPDALGAEVVVNCTGWRAEQLVDDPALLPRLGRTALARGGSALEDVLVDERDPDALVYAIPRRDELVLGGLDRPRARADEMPAPDARELAALLARHRARGISPGTTREQFAWRPGRRGGPRVEREGRVIHAYGHGGAGYTLAYGCALELRELVREALDERR